MFVSSIGKSTFFKWIPKETLKVAAGRFHTFARFFFYEISVFN